MSSQDIKPNTEPVYSIHPSVRHMQAIIGNLAQKTGHSLDAWFDLISKETIENEKECRKWLKLDFNLGGATASIIAQRYFKTASEEITDEEAYLNTAAEYVKNMYSSGKNHLRPLHDKLIEIGLSLGDDVKICPCKTMVPLYRKHVFAQIKPATKSRIDLGLALKNTNRSLNERLIDTGGLAKNDRITHRFATSTLQDIDSIVKEWLQIAYESDEK